jgi:hypothetical protein
MEDRAFRRALGEFATGVAVVTARGKGEELVGVTMSSFNSVSLDPPLVLFSVDRKARSLPAMLEARGFAVNILARDQEHISNHFALALSNKWDQVKTSVSRSSADLGRDGAFRMRAFRELRRRRPRHLRGARRPSRDPLRCCRAIDLLSRPLSRSHRRSPV